MLNRRQYLAASAGFAVALPPAAPAARAAAGGGPSPPPRDDFVPTEWAYLDNGSHHPTSIGAKAAVEKYIASRTDPAGIGFELDSASPLAKFARLINADPAEVTYVQSTTAGEQQIIRALGLPEAGAHIVSDTLHFFGSLPLYEEMAKAGCEVTWLRPVDGRIRIEDMRAAVKKGTKLVALSLVSTINGFEHDLKVVCDIAHAAGAFVYADIVHAAGCVPIDVKASGVDFAACATYKWLMGDFGLGFLYVRKDVLPKLKRVNYGYFGMNAFRSHIYPYDPAGERIVDYGFRPDTTGSFAIGTMSDAVMAQLDHSLDYINGLGVPAIQAHAQTMVAVLKKELPKRGYPLMTPPESRAPIVTCALEDARKKLGEPLKAAVIHAAGACG